MPNKLIIASKKKILERSHMNVWETTYLDKNNQLRTWDWIERPYRPIFIFPIAGDNIILIKNYRIPLEQYVIEIPAGMKDNPEESDEETARRELLEETGYTASTLIPVRSWPYRSGASNTLCEGFIATGLTKVSDDIGEATEDIRVIEVPAVDLVDFYLDGEADCIVDLPILAFYAVAKHLKLVK